jgi:archaellin
MVEDVVNEITSYIQVKSILGKYYSHEGTYTIQKIIMLVTPLFHINYELSNLIVQFQTKNSIIDLYYDENPITPNGDLFSEKNWINNNNSQYSCFITLDKDESVKQFHVLNDPTDMLYLTINLPKEMYIHKGESAKISLIMGTGIIRTISIQAPIPTSSIVEL